jgi:heterodisulfide reductase subunit A
MMDRTVAVIGGGVAGLTAALELARFGFQVDVIEKADFAGGHAIRFACKATDQCVKCGACIVEEKLAQAIEDPGIRLLSGSRIEKISKSRTYEIKLTQKAVYIDARNCTACGICLEQCPEDDAIIRGVSKSHSPFLVINEETCRYMADQSCTRCRDECPEKAIIWNWKVLCAVKAGRQDLRTDTRPGRWPLSSAWAAEMPNSITCGARSFAAVRPCGWPI